MDTVDDVNTADDKKKRKRNKQVLKSIRQQVEFYFGDANLRKDRFLGQEISKSEDRYVDIEIIASFNRMQVLCSDPGLISQAISTSDLLELNDDKTKIRRKVPLGEPEYDPDDVTVYVECLPKFVDHDWVRKVFGVCGSVEYVSLPRYKSSGDIKGFAFVEFKTPEEATRACEMLNNPPEEESDSIGKFPKTKGGRYVPIDEDKNGKTKDDTSRTSHRKRSYSENDNKPDNHKRQKRKHRESESSDGKPDRDRRKRHHSDDTHKTKKKKADDEKSERIDKTDVENEEVKSKEGHDQERTKDFEENVKSNQKRNEKEKDKSGEKDTLKYRKRKLTESDDEELVSKKNRKESGDGERSKGHTGDGERSKAHAGDRERSKGHEPDADVISDDEDDSKRDSDNEDKRRKRSRKRKPEKKKEVKEAEFQLKVISKKEWLDLKEKYLSLQKASIAKLKEAFRTGGVSNMVQSEKMIKSTEPEFTPGVVLKLESKTPLESRQLLKDELQICAPVAYIDLQPGEQSGFVRCQSTEGASQILNKYGPNQTEGNLSMTLLEGDEEEQYWEKLKADRMNKLSSKQKKKKKRGIDRVLCKAEKVSLADSESSSHIRFDDDDE